MDGIEGLKLISITPNILSNTQIVFLKLIIVFLSITSITSLSLACKSTTESKARFIPPLILTTISILLTVIIIFGLNNYKNDLANGNIDTIYTLEIINEDYNIDSNIYKTLEIADNTIKLIKEKTKD